MGAACSLHLGKDRLHALAVRYKPFLDELGLTYTQYIVMQALWEREELSVKELGACLYLDSGTLTPVLKTLEGKGLLRRRRSTEDERVLVVTLSENGRELKEQAVEVPSKIQGCVSLDRKDAADLYRILHKMMDTLGPDAMPAHTAC